MIDADADLDDDEELEPLPDWPNPARPGPGVRLCALDEVAEPGAKSFAFEVGTDLFLGFVIRKNGRLYGYVNACTHIPLPLGGRRDQFLTRDDKYILCSAHGAMFKVENGVCLTVPCVGERLFPWPVEARDGAIFTA